ncbi:MAG: hypothetical protein HY342_05905 [Candidatus Lambdaproteobacteria bacterium]|nr:hypothetical protein [Candidatus Lambdaproteobacteria bacterium]
MSSAQETVGEFLKQWKPIAAMPPGNPVRRGVLRCMTTDDVAQRASVLAKTNALFALHERYREIGIFREDAPPHAADMAALLAVKLDEFAQAIADGKAQNFLELIQKGFQFGRFEPEAKHVALRKFLLHLWHMRIGGPGLKYSMYGNGVLYTAGGLSHEEMAREYNQLGFGGDKPLFGGQFYRIEQLEFHFDTGSTTFARHVDPGKVEEAVRRWVRLTGGDATRLALAYLPGRQN